MTCETALLHLVTGEDRGQGVWLFVCGRHAALPGAAKSVKSKAKGTAWRALLPTVNKKNGTEGRQRSDYGCRCLYLTQNESSKEDLKGELS